MRLVNAAKNWLWFIIIPAYIYSYLHHKSSTKNETGDLHRYIKDRKFLSSFNGHTSATVDVKCQMANCRAGYSSPRDRVPRKSRPSLWESWHDCWNTSVSSHRTLFLQGERQVTEKGKFHIAFVKEFDHVYLMTLYQLILVCKWVRTPPP
jgi:hypothetical protein